MNSNQNHSIKVHKQECTSPAKAEIKSVALGSNQGPGVQIQKQECASTVNADTGSINLGTPYVTAKVISPGVSTDKVCTGEDAAVESSDAGAFTAEVLFCTRAILHLLPLICCMMPIILGFKTSLSIPYCILVNSMELNRNVDTEIYHKWRIQSDFTFGFVPLAEQIMPKDMSINDSKALSPIKIHSVVRATEKPNFMEARLPVKSQLNV